MDERTIAERTALVTGGAKGIGRSVSEHLAAAGWHLVLCGRDGAALLRAQGEIEARHPVRVATVALDLSEPTAASELFARFGGPQELPAAMVCAAADYGVLGPLAQVDFARFKRSFDLNFFSVAELVQRYLRMALSGGPSPRRRIALFGGGGLGSAQVPPGASAYQSAKAALYRLVEVVHEEVHARGIEVNCVLPGLVDSGMADQALAAGPGLGEVYEAARKARAGGGTSPELVAALIVRLFSDACAGVSGRLLSARFDGAALETPGAVLQDPHRFRLRRIDQVLFGKLP